MALSLAGYPFVAAVSNALGMASTNYSLAMRIFIIVLSGILLVKNGSLLLRAGWVGYAVVVFWVFYFLRIYADVSNPYLSLFRSASDYWMWSLGACLIPMLALSTVSRECSIAESMQLCFWLALSAAILAVVFGSATAVASSGLEYESGRLRLNSLNPISAGHLGLSLLIVSVWKAFAGARGLRELSALIGIAIGFYLLLASASRGPLVAFILVAFFYLSSLRSKKLLIVMPLFCVVALGTFFAIESLENQGQFTLLSRILAGASGADEAVSERVIAIRGGVKQFLEDPIFGSSLEERVTGLYPHNVFLEALMATGILGGALFLFFALFGVRASFSILRKRSDLGWVPLIYIQYLVGAQFSGAIYSSTIFWAFLGIVFGIYTSLGSQERSEVA